MPTFEGSTVQKAIKKGLKALNLTEVEVTVKVVSEGKRGGFLGLGGDPAVVQVEKIPEPVPEAELEPDRQAQPLPTPAVQDGDDVIPKTQLTESKKPETAEKPAAQPATVVDNDEVLKDLGVYITSICATLKTPVLIKLSRQQNEVVYQLDTNKEGLVIGKHGRTINSLQYLAQTYFNHYGKGKFRITLNVGNYRQRREETLKHLADKAAREVIASGKPYLLDDMPSFERKVIHQQLADNTHVDTISEGKEPHRYVIIKSKFN
ncbi:RNA-binding cell elongation regulator Jag/EloR [Agrilactobacillus yilanensis]|uniref:RNA-binding protein KhpB n=1 Tax=Agrilactobacillus yilanensis TaxID=2485997 RepID=A0ABW4JA56_9LACO|nr:RNA-binding cell elongation regulator Jag/EloR [Agrilactobacillus yilanensis]